MKETQETKNEFSVTGTKWPRNSSKEGDPKGPVVSEKETIKEERMEKRQKNNTEPVS